MVIDATPKTVGSQADKNSGPGRRYWHEKQLHDHALDNPKATSQKTPWWRKGPVNKELGKITTQQQAINYIETGKITDPLTPSITT